MEELIDQFMQHGLTPQQAEATIQTIGQWLEENYPVAAVVLTTWVKKQNSNLS